MLIKNRRRSIFPLLLGSLCIKDYQKQTECKLNEMIIYDAISLKQ